MDWSKVSEHMGGDRSSYQHRMRWHSVLKHRVAGANSRPNSKKEIVMEPWSATEVDLLLAAVEACARVDGSNAMDEHINTLHMHEHEMQQHHDSGATSAQPDHDDAQPSDDPVNESSSGISLPVPPAIPPDHSGHFAAGPVSMSALGGALLAHTVDWIAASNKLAEDYAMIGGLIAKRSPLQCLHMWRQVMNARMREAALHMRLNPTPENHSDRPPGIALSRNSPWSDLEDDRLTEAVGVYDGQGRGGGVDWGKVCEFLGSVRTYNQCRHRWHNVIKHRSLTGDENGRYGDVQDMHHQQLQGYHHSHGENEDHHGYDAEQHQWAMQQQQEQHDMMQHQQQGDADGQEASGAPHPSYANLEKYDV